MNTGYVRLRQVLIVYSIFTMLSCTGTPVPVPIPINKNEINLSSPTTGNVVVMGLGGAAVDSDTVKITNSRTGDVRLGGVSDQGTFSVLIPAATADPLELIPQIGSTAGERYIATVSAPAALPAPVASVTTPDKSGQIMVSGTSAGDRVLIAQPRTAAAVATPVNKGGAFSVSLTAKVGDLLYVMAVNGSGSASEYRLLTVGQPSGCTDIDKDGYGAVGTDLGACAGSTTDSDCNDGQGQVHPGQVKYFTVKIQNTASDYDYDCDGKSEQEFTALAGCASTPTCDAHGWQTAAPACGVQGVWIQCVLLKISCTESPQTRTQACR